MTTQKTHIRNTSIIDSKTLPWWGYVLCMPITIPLIVMLGSFFETIFEMLGQ